MKLWSVGFLIASAVTTVACRGSYSDRSTPSIHLAERELPADINPDGIGLNLGSLEFDCDDPTSCPLLDQALNHAVTLRTRWIRLEISNQRRRDFDVALSYWAGVVARINSAGIRVLGALNNTLWDQGAIDPDECDDVEYAPTDFGNRLVNEWLPIATAFVDRLRPIVHEWEIWNEGNAPATKLCKSNYAFLLTEASIRWQDMSHWDVTLGPSTNSLGSSRSAADYLDILFHNTQKVLYYRSQHQDNPPWARVYDHPYPCHTTDCGTQGEAADVFLGNQSAAIRAVQPRGIWFTELGFETTDDQVHNLFVSYNASLNRGFAEKVFWFALTDCAGAGTYGLLSTCEFTSDPRLSYWAFQSLSTNALICHTVTPCKYTSAAAGCDTAECPAFKFQTGWGQTVRVTSWGYGEPLCNGAPWWNSDDNLVVPSEGNWLVWVQLPLCPAQNYSARWTISPCSDSYCGDYGCHDPMPNCSPPGSPEPQALELVLRRTSVATSIANPP